MNTNPKGPLVIAESRLTSLNPFELKVNSPPQYLSHIPRVTKIYRRDIELPLENSPNSLIQK